MIRITQRFFGKTQDVTSDSEISQVYNLLWLSPRFAHERGPQYYDPIPEKTIANILSIAKNNSTVDVKLWVDSLRLSEQQMHFLKEMCNSASGNLGICDLRCIPEYGRTPLFNESDTSSNWRADKHTVIWRQVDTAKFLISLQGNYDQSFYSDSDITNLAIGSPEVQGKIIKHGIIISGGLNGDGSVWFENQMFGFNRRWRSFFRGLYQKTIQDVGEYRENGWQAFSDVTDKRLRPVVDSQEIFFQCEHDGNPAYHPGEEGYSPGGRRRI